MDQEQQRYERAHARVKAIKGFYIHASAFMMVNIALFAINVGGRGLVVLLASDRLGYRLWGARPGCIRLQRRRTLGPGLGGTQDARDDGQGARTMKMRTAMQAKRSASGAWVAFGRAALGAMGLGALAVGVTAVGAAAIGALAIRALAVKRGRIERLDIGELEVGQLRVRELIVERERTSWQGASASSS